MNTKKYIVRFSGEITIKSDPVRKKIIKLLKENIKRVLWSFEYEFSITWNWDFLQIEVYNLNEENIFLQRLQKIFGIKTILSVTEYEFATKEDILEYVKQHFFDKLVGKNFFVRVKRVGKHDFSSPELERYIWSAILKSVEWTRVNLEQADILVQLEVKHKHLFVIHSKTIGLWWYPTGFTGKVLSMISGWFDSTVSSYMAMKRGLEVDFLFFDLGFPPQTLWVKQVSYFLWKEYEKSYSARFIRVDFSFLVELLLEKATPRFRSVLLKRYMLKTTNFLNTYLSENYSFFKKPYQALVKWDSLGQVSSQTLDNLVQIDPATDLLVLRPLIWFDKDEIIWVSREIGTFDFAHNMPEYCGVVSQNPSTQATKEQIEEEEKNLDSIFFDTIISKIEISKVADLLEDVNMKDYNGEVVTELWDGILIDIREKEKILKFPLGNVSHHLEIPFYQINHRFKELDQTKRYYLYCEKGTLSKLHAMYLQEMGFSNVAVFRFWEK